MGQITEEMKKRRVTGTAGGGMVEIEVNGLMEVLRCRIDPQLFAQNDRELIEDLVVAAVNQAIAQGQADARRRAARPDRRVAAAGDDSTRPWRSSRGRMRRKGRDEG